MNPNKPNKPSSSSASILVISPVLTFLTVIAERIPSPKSSSTTVSHMNSNLGFLNAFSWIDLAARSSSLRWINVTLRAKPVRYIASSTAESPPPTTYTSKSSKKLASHVAQKDTPLPTNSASFLHPIGFGVAPVAIITTRPSYSPLAVITFLTGPSNCTSLIVSDTLSAPNLAACSVILAIKDGPLSPSTI